MSPRTRRTDHAIAAALFVAEVVWLLVTARDLGYTRDEGMYFEAASAYRRWVELFSSHPGAALGEIDRYFAVNNEHPALMKLAFAASHWLLHERLGLLSEPGTAYRFPSLLLAGAMVAVLFLWGRRELGRTAGLVAALFFAFLPRVFFHAHLACFDLPVAALCLLTTAAYARSLATLGWRWPLVTGVLFGLALDTKLAAWFLPVQFGLHFALLRGRAIAELGTELGRKRFSVPRVWLALAGIGPLVLYLGWPWLWPAPFVRLGEYFQFHRAHVHYNIEFFGVTYHEPPFPRAYAWWMTLATVPLSTLLSFAIGFVAAVRSGLIAFRRDGWFRGELASAEGIQWLWILGVLVNYGPWWSPETPIYGGTKHWITAYPFLCLLAARGFVTVSGALGELVRSRLRHGGSAERAVPALTAASLLVAPLALTLGSHPFGLSAYTPIVGGAPGAANLGLNRGFWGYTTGSLVAFLNEKAPAGARIYLHDTLGASFDMLRRDGRLRTDLRGTLDLARSDLALYHHEPHMSRVEAQIWVLYGTVTPAAVVAHDGVPVVWVYQRLADGP